VPAVTADEFHQRVERSRSLLQGGERLSKDDAAEIIRLSNTASYYSALEAAGFVEQVRELYSDRIAPALPMEAGRGFALRSDELDLTYGGTLPEGSRYRIDAFDQS
jgi:hypothetical protein